MSVCVCVHVHVCACVCGRVGCLPMPRCICGGQKITCKGWLSPSIMWVPESKPRPYFSPGPSFLLAIVYCSGVSIPSFLLFVSGKPLTSYQSTPNSSGCCRTQSVSQSLLGPSLGSQHRSILDLRTHDKGQRPLPAGSAAR